MGTRKSSREKASMDYDDAPEEDDGEKGADVVLVIDEVSCPRRIPVATRACLGDGVPYVGPCTVL